MPFHPASTDTRHREPEPAHVLAQVLRQSPITRSLFDRWEHIGLPDCWLVAGAVAQTVWNDAHTFAPEHGIKDVDIVYFDADLREQSESHHAERLRRLLKDLPVQVDVKNEARVHLWYAQKFGYAIQPYTSTAAALATFPTTAGSVAVRPSAEGIEVCAPFGMEDLLGLVVRPNKVQITEPIYAAKVKRWRALWPRLTILDW
jgi:uncharacterized protein